MMRTTRCRHEGGDRVTANLRGQSRSRSPRTAEPQPLPITERPERSSPSPQKGGPATIAVAERVESETRYPATRIRARRGEADRARDRAHERDRRRLARRGGEIAASADVARRGSPRRVRGDVGRARRHAPTTARPDTAIDIYGFQTVTYRRRIEPINLYTLRTGLFRLRDGSAHVRRRSRSRGTSPSCGCASRARSTRSRRTWTEQRDNVPDPRARALCGRA